MESFHQPRKRLGLERIGEVLGFTAQDVHGFTSEEGRTSDGEWSNKSMGKSCKEESTRANDRSNANGIIREKGNVDNRSTPHTNKQGEGNVNNNNALANVRAVGWKVALVYSGAAADLCPTGHVLLCNKPIAPYIGI
jgi:hypothetical protein